MRQRGIVINGIFHLFQIMPSRNQFPWARAGVWVSGLDIIIKHQKLGRFLALEAG